MALPASGPISINQVNIELGVAGNTQRSFNDAALRTLFAVPSGQISMSNVFGKSNAPPVTAGSQNFTTPGISNFIVPAFNTLTVNVWGGGAPGAVSVFGATYARTDPSGGTSSFGSYLSATGGAGTVYTYDPAGGFYLPSSVNAGGNGTGGDINLSGGSGYAEYNMSIYIGYSYGGAGGGTTYGGGATRILSGSTDNYPNRNGYTGNAYGGGGTGASFNDTKYGGSSFAVGGGGGGFARKTFSAGSLTVGSTISVTVGAGGAYTTDGTVINTHGGSGAPGAVTISWS